VIQSSQGTHDPGKAKDAAAAEDEGPPWSLRLVEFTLSDWQRSGSAADTYRLPRRRLPRRWSTRHAPCRC